MITAEAQNPARHQVAGSPVQSATVLASMLPSHHRSSARWNTLSFVPAVSANRVIEDMNFMSSGEPKIALSEARRTISVPYSTRTARQAAGCGPRQEGSSVICIEISSPRARAASP